jgi:long-chain acyl-CoA synthetase
MGLAADCSHEELATHPKTLEMIQQDVDKVNLELAQFESIKKFCIAKQEFTTGNFLTPSLKIKRKVINSKFSQEIEAMYQ